MVLAGEAAAITTVTGKDADDEADAGRLSPELHDPADVGLPASAAEEGLSPPVSPSLEPGDAEGAEDALEEADHLEMLEQQRQRIIAAQKRAAEGKSTEEEPVVAVGTCILALCSIQQPQARPDVLALEGRTCVRMLCEVRWWRLLFVGCKGRWETPALLRSRLCSEDGNDVEGARLYQEERSRGMAADEDLLGDELALNDTYLWQDKYRPRKPR